MQRELKYANEISILNKIDFLKELCDHLWPIKDGSQELQYLEKE